MVGQVQLALTGADAGGLEPLEEFGFPWHLSAEFKPAMDRMLAGRWEKAGQFVTDMKPPIDFDGPARPHACDLHSWEPVGYALRAHEVFADRRYWDLALGFVLDWLERYWRPHSGSTDAEHLDRLIADERSFAWYDMAVGRRIFRLAYVLDAARRDPESDAGLLADLWSALQFHHAVLGREHFFRGHSNHGIHQALGQLAAARRFIAFPESAAQLALATHRLLSLLDAHFTSEGVHREHSPGYHYGLMTSFVGVRALLDGGDIAQRLAAMEEALSWMIMPDGRIVPIGDTDPKPMARLAAFVEQFASPALRHQMSGGKLGSPPAPGVKAFMEAGYAFARLTEPGAASASYLAQIAGFHSRTHKHADHLSFVWHDRGREVLTDPGRYAYAGRTDKGSDLFNQGFWYSDPKRIYVETTRAHNCVEIDGASYPRRGVKPFGSALSYAGEQAGLAVTDCEATHLRFVRHRRILVMGPGHFLLVLDWLNDATAEHDYRQWFQLAPAWQAALEGGKVTAAAEAGSFRMLNLIAGNAVAEPVRGQETPQLQGWTSDKAHSLIPSTSLCVQAPRGKQSRFATLFVLDGDAGCDPAVIRLNTTLTTGRIAWRDGLGSHELRFSPDAASGNITFELR